MASWIRWLPNIRKKLFVSCSYIIKNADTDKYKYSGYAIGFDRHATFSIGNGFDKNVIIFAADMSSSVHVDNNKKYILILHEGPTQGLNDTILTAEKMYLINFTESRKKLSLIFHYNGVNSYLFVNGVEIHKFKSKRFGNYWNSIISRKHFKRLF